MSEKVKPKLHGRSGVSDALGNPDFGDKVKPDPDECPKCGHVWNDEGDLTMADMHIDIQSGFVALTNRCEGCGAKLERFYDWDRTEASE